MKRFIKMLLAVAVVSAASVIFASPAQAGGGFSFSFGYNNGGGRHHRYYDRHCGPRYYPRSYVSYSYVYAPPPVYYYAPPPPPVVYRDYHYAPPPPCYRRY